MDKDLKYEAFMKSLDAELRGDWFQKSTQLSLAAGLSQGAVSKIYNKKTTATDESQLKIAQACKCKSVEEFIQKHDKKTDWVDPITAEHQKLVKEFPSKKLAKELNELLVKIDKENSLKFAEIASIIKKIANGIEFIEKHKYPEDTETQGLPTGSG